MPSEIIESNDRSLTLQITVNIGSSMLSSEETLQRELNNAGAIATGKILESFDTDGAPIIFGKSQTLRCLNQTSGRWDQFWKKIDRYGLPAAA